MVGGVVAVDAVEMHCANCGRQLWLDHEVYELLAEGSAPDPVLIDCKRCVREMKLVAEVPEEWRKEE